MKPVQVTMDEELLRQLDALPEVKTHGRSAFIRRIASAYLRHRRKQEIREAYRQGYGDTPVAANEFDVDEDLLAWPED